jgi:hypothetical protein
MTLLISECAKSQSPDARNSFPFLFLYCCIKVYRIRSKFLQAVLRQDVGWYDTKSSNDFASRITE